MTLLAAATEVLANKWYLALRATCPDEQYSVDDECRESFEWDLDNDCSSYHTTGETAGGTCGFAIDTDVDSPEELVTKIEEALIAFNKIGYGYVGGQTILIAGRSTNSDYQMDNNEIRIRGAWVQAILN
jgi:hypothetical protein